MAFGRGDGPGLSAGLLSGIFIALGVAVAGVMIGGSLVEARTADRRVTVTGAAEREVKSDLAVWTLTLSASSSDLTTAQTLIDDQVTQLETYLTSVGFDQAEFSVDTPNLAVAENAAAEGADRYDIEQPLLIRSANVDLVAQVSRQLGELARQGLAATSPDGPAYLFSRLHDVRADLLEEAALDARDAAQAFADQAGAQLGGVREATHGETELLPRDGAPWLDEPGALYKRVRVTSTVTYQIAP